MARIEKPSSFLPFAAACTKVRSGPEAADAVPSTFRHEGREPDIRCVGDERRLWAAVSKGRRNTLIFLERWSVYNEVSHTDVLYGQAEV